MAALSTREHGCGCLNSLLRSSRSVWSLLVSSESILLLRCRSLASRVLAWPENFLGGSSSEGIKDHEAPLGPLGLRGLDGIAVCQGDERSELCACPMEAALSRFVYLRRTLLKGSVC